MDVGPKRPTADQGCRESGFKVEFYLQQLHGMQYKGPFLPEPSLNRDQKKL